MSYPQDVAFPTTGVAHLTYHRDDVGFNFVYPGGDHIEVSAGGYNEPLSHLIPFRPNGSMIDQWYYDVVNEFISECDEWCRRWPEGTGHGWFFGPEEQLVYIKRGWND